MAACADINFDDINQLGEVDFDKNQETASQNQDKVSSKSFFMSNTNFGVTKKVKCAYQILLPSSPSTPPNT